MLIRAPALGLLEAEIERLENAHGDPLGLRDFNYDGFWAHAREIAGLFKTLKSIAGPDRRQLWGRYSSACAETQRARTITSGRPSILSSRPAN